MITALSLSEEEHIKTLGFGEKYEFMIYGLLLFVKNIFEILIPERESVYKIELVSAKKFEKPSITIDSYSYMLYGDSFRLVIGIHVSENKLGDLIFDVIRAMFLYSAFKGLKDPNILELKEYCEKHQIPRFEIELMMVNITKMFIKENEYLVMYPSESGYQPLTDEVIAKVKAWTKALKKGGSP